MAVVGSSHYAHWCSGPKGLCHDEGWFGGILTSHIKPGELAIVVGAHIGTTVKPLLDHGCIVVAFEPNRDAAACLQFNCPAAKVYKYGISDKKGVAKFAALKDNAGASHISHVGEISIELRALDAFHLEPDLIVMDCEGYEVKALRGARETIAKSRPVMVMEVFRGALERAGDSEDALYSLLDEMGYSTEILQWQCQRGSDQYDILALPIDKVE